VTRIVVLGDVMVDVVCKLAGPIAPGSDAPARIAMGGGGSAANVAAWLAEAGVRQPVLAGRVGADERGRTAEAELRAAGVDTRLAVDGERATGTCVVLVAPDGERSMIPDPGANDALASEDLPHELLVAGAHLHVAGYALLRAGSRPAARSAIARARARGMSVSVDPSSSALLSASFLDYAVEGAGLLLPNVDEAAALSGERDPERAAALLAERVPEVVVTLGAEGALWTDGRSLRRAAARPANDSGEGGGAPGALVDTTGAGDAFAAGLLAARLAGAGPEAALAAGCRLAGVAVRTPGARPAPGRSGQHGLAPAAAQAAARKPGQQGD
jgi:sugar/nucleoside kinase (ribokinase family)